MHNGIFCYINKKYEAILTFLAALSGDPSQTASGRGTEDNAKAKVTEAEKAGKKEKRGKKR